MIFHHSSSIAPASIIINHLSSIANNQHTYLGGESKPRSKSPSTANMQTVPNETGAGLPWPVSFGRYPLAGLLWHARAKRDLPNETLPNETHPTKEVNADTECEQPRALQAFLDNENMAIR